MKTLILDLKRNLFLIVVMWGATISIGMSLVSSKKAYAQEDVKSKIQHKERLEWEKHQKELIKLERLHNSQTRWGKIYDIQNLTASLFVDETTSRLPVDSDDSRAVDFGDVDGDNDFDIIVANDGQNKLYINDGTGHFVDETSSRLPNDNFASFDVELGDVDNDGDLDIFVTNEFGDQDRLLINNGSGLFSDVTSGRLPNESMDRDSGTDAEFGDVDRDGDHDIIIANDFGDRNRLLINDGSGNFTDETDTRLLADSDSSQAVELGDIDNDGDLDIIIANGFFAGHQNRLLINNGNGIFADETNLRLPNVLDRTEGIAVGDVDSDGDLDVFFANVIEKSRLLINNGAGNFTDETSNRLPVGTDFNEDASLGDVDKDGDLDIFVADVGQDELLINNGAGFFTVGDFPIEDDFGYDAEFIDVDKDNDIDIIVANIVLGAHNPQNRLYINTLPPVAALNPPRNLTATVSDKSVNLAWDPPETTRPDTIEIFYDDGSAERGITGNFSGAEMAVRFTPGTYPVDLFALMFFGGGDVIPDNYGVRVYLDPSGSNNGPTGSPVFEGVISVNTGGTNGGIFPQSITINSGDFYISLYFISGTTSYFTIGQDTDSDAERSWLRTSSGFVLAKDLGFSGNLIIRAFVERSVSTSTLASSGLSNDGLFERHGELQLAEIDFSVIHERALASKVSFKSSNYSSVDIASSYNNALLSTRRSSFLFPTATLQSYNVYRSTSTPVEINQQNLIGNVDANTTTFTDNNVQSGVTYYYVVTAVYDVGESGPSNEVSAMVPPEVPIFPTATSPQFAGTEFWVDINVGTNEKPVSDLFGVSFVLNFTQTNFMDVVTPHSNNVTPGDFIGSDVIFVQTVDEAAGKVSIGITRKTGQSGVSGEGTVARVKYIANSNTPDGTQVLFSITDVEANNSTGGSIPLTPRNLTVTISAGVLVWPGDTNNNGVVNQADVLPIGLYWNQTGPPRQNASTSWTGQPATPWPNQSCTYADATGNGIVNQADILPIGLNWGRTHGTNPLAFNKKTTNEQTATNLGIVISGDTDPGQDFFINVYANEVTNLFGLSFEFVYSLTTFIDPISAEVGSGNLLGDDVLFFPNINKTSGKVSVGISRKAGQGGVDGSGLVTRIKMTMSNEAVIGQDTTWLFIENVQANDPNGNPIEFDVTNLTHVPLITDVEATPNKTIPAEYALHQNYPNPFNPETTIQYQLPERSEVKLVIYNLMGQRVATLVDEQQLAGFYSVRWDGKDYSGRNVASGVYLYRLETRGFVQVKKLVLVR